MNKHRKRFRVILEIVFMVLGVLCAIMPRPFPLIVPILIGTVRIISNAIQRDKAASITPKCKHKLLSTVKRAKTITPKKAGKTK